MYVSALNSFMKEKYTFGLEMINNEMPIDCTKLTVLFVLHLSSGVTHSASFVLPLIAYVTVEQ